MVGQRHCTFFTLPRSSRSSSTPRCFVPIVYSLFCGIAYTFPNGKYYSTLQGLSTSEFIHTLVNVLLYRSLELVSYVALDLVMRRTFRLSAFKQTAFVLETQWKMVQSKLTLWMLVVLQFSSAATLRLRL